MRDAARSSPDAERAQRGSAPSDDRLEAFARVARRGFALISADGELLEASERARELLDAVDGAREALRNALREVAHLPAARGESGVRAELGAAEGAEPIVLELHGPSSRAGDAGPPVYFASVGTRAEFAGESANLVLADRMRRLDESAHGLAHDLRAPLNAIVLNLELVERFAGGGEGAGEQAVHVRIVKQELARLNRLLQSLLAEVTQGADDPKPFDLRALVEEVAERARARRRRPRVELELELPDEPVRLVAPRGALRQVLFGLVVNAVDAGGDAGPVRVELSSSGGEARITFRDRGSGLSEAVLARPPRVRADGSGIGLHVARTLVERLGGRLVLGEAEGSGTQLELRLPVS